MLGTPSHPAINGMLPPKPSSWISIIGPWWPSGDVHSVSPERTCVRSGNMYNYSTHEYVHIYYVYNMVYIYTYLEMYISCLYTSCLYIYMIYDIWYVCILLYTVCNHMHIWSCPPPSHRGIAAPSPAKHRTWIITLRYHVYTILCCISVFVVAI